MEVPAKRTHTYHGEAHAFCGDVNFPFKQTIPPQVALAMKGTDGGYRSNWAGEFEVESVASYDQAWTQVAGSCENEGEGPWNTLVSTTVENINILNVVTCDRIVSQISLEHPAKGHHPRVSFVGSQFVNLKISGAPVHVDLNFDFCELDESDYPQQAIVQDKRFIDRIQGQYKQVASAVPSTGKQMPKTDGKEYDWGITQKRLAEPEPVVLCSLVKNIEGKFPGKLIPPNIIYVRQFGWIFLSELVVNKDTYELTMLRVTLGCPVGGSGGFGISKGNGSTEP